MAKYRSRQDAFSDKDLFASSAITLMIDSHGTECLSWEPETIEMELRAESVNPSRSLMDKILAATTVLTSNLFQVDFRAFNEICNALSGDPAGGYSLLPADVYEMAWGCAEARLLLGPEEFDRGFSVDIARYVGSALSSIGITKAPSMLKWAVISPDEELERDTVLASDAFMSKAYWDSHHELVAEIEDYVRLTAVKLLEQMNDLPLKNGKAEFLRD
jgi:hypothetical protein